MILLLATACRPGTLQYAMLFSLIGPSQSDGGTDGHMTDLHKHILDINKLDISY